MSGVQIDLPSFKFHFLRVHYLVPQVLLDKTGELYGTSYTIVRPLV